MLNAEDALTLSPPRVERPFRCFQRSTVPLGTACCCCVGVEPSHIAYCTRRSGKVRATESCSSSKQHQAGQVATAHYRQHSTTHSTPRTAAARLSIAIEFTLGTTASHLLRCSGYALDTPTHGPLGCRRHSPHIPTRNTLVVVDKQ